jgi:hypothetical protein
MDNYSKSKLENMNYDRKYGSNWITNVNKIDDNQRYKLYATNDATISSGRKYVALPANKILSEGDYQKYNLMK